MKYPMITRQTRRAPSLAALAISAALAELSLGCATPPEEVGVAVEAALNPNALNPNALNPNALDPHALAAIQDPGDAGALSRQLLLYTVSCAFSLGQFFYFSWTDASSVCHNESYPGLLGLAPDWATEPLDPAGQLWVSECLASRVNAKGVSVMLSSRGAYPPLATTAQERQAYQTREATFFGNLFTPSPRVYACYDPLSVLPAQFQNRVCAQPAILNLAILPTAYDCGPITVLGPCLTVLGLLTLGSCPYQDSVDRYFYGCSLPGYSAYPASLTTFLAGPIPW